MIVIIRAQVLLVLFLGSTFFASTLHAQTTQANGGCLTQTRQQIGHDLRWLWKGIEAAPRNSLRPPNLEWELPVAAATGILIASADAPASRRIQSPSLQRNANRFSNIGIALELAAAGATYGVGCFTARTPARNAGLTALEAAGAASAIDLLLKFGTNRQLPTQDSGRGEFWEGGTSFASSHAAASFAFASVIAHRYPHNRWATWGSYAAATAVSLARFPAKKHFLSDIVVGGTLGYVTGAYLASQH
jgi:membrane-associated phospholipid phosphatase